MKHSFHLQVKRELKALKFSVAFPLTAFWFIGIREIWKYKNTYICIYCCGQSNRVGISIIYKARMIKIVVKNNE